MVKNNDCLRCHRNDPPKRPHISTSFEAIGTNPIWIEIKSWISQIPWHGILKAKKSCNSRPQKFKTFSTIAPPVRAAPASQAYGKIDRLSFYLPLTKPPHTSSYNLLSARGARRIFLSIYIYIYIYIT
jgi:hypothetical protein